MKLIAVMHATKFVNVSKYGDINYGPLRNATFFKDKFEARDKCFEKDKVVELEVNVVKECEFRHKKHVTRNS